MKPSRILVVDPQMAGVAGDMFVAALLDLGADTKKVVSVMEAVVDYIPNCDKIKIKPKRVKRSHISGLYLDIQIQESFETRSGQVLLDAVASIVKDLNLSNAAAAYAKRAIRFLVESEAKVHGHTPKAVHLHAAGSADTIIDIVGAATALDHLQLADPKTTSFWTLPIAVGNSTFLSSHGELAVPGPAVAGMLTTANLLFKGSPIEKELATPTGVALIAALEPVSAATYPMFRPMAVGYGAGTADLMGTPNLVRILVGEQPPVQRFLQDQVIVLETNVDDVSGETLGYLIERLMSEGAKDVTILPTITKKNRPGHLVSVLAAPENEHQLTHLLITETGSLGVRITSYNRHLLARDFHSVKIKVGEQTVKVRVKVATDRQGIIHQVKAEYEDVREAARTTKRPLFEIAHLAEATARQQLLKTRDVKPRRRRKSK